MLFWSARTAVDLKFSRGYTELTRGICAQGRKGA
jgi:hypothetical protein